MTQTLNPDSEDARNPDLHREELNYLLTRKFPGAVPGKDFVCAHLVDEVSGERIGAAIIADWKLDADRPAPEDLHAFYEEYREDVDGFATEREAELLRSGIGQERDRRIDAGFIFNGVRYQSRAKDRENIAGAATAALAAVVNGAEAGDYRWHGGEADFVWIAEDNSLVTMDAPTVHAFGQAAMAHKQAHIFAARALKDSLPVPDDFADDSHWPE